MNENPYQAPSVGEVAAPVPPMSGAAMIRQEHLRHEASLKGMGSLFFLGGVVLVLVIIGITRVAIQSDGSGGPTYPMMGILLYAAVIPLQFVSWWGLRKLRPWAKIPAGILSGLGLLALGLGTIVSIYFLYLLFSRKGRMVLSPEYQAIIDQTPGMKYRTPMWNWILLGILVLLLIGIVAFAMFSN